MALYPSATLRLLPENRYQPHITPVLAIWHSAVDAPGPTSLYGYFKREDITLESHFFIKNDGEVEQYMDTLVRGDANYRANGFWKAGKYCGAISVETEDDGDPNRRIWTPAQVQSSIRLGKWIAETHGIPPTLAREWNGTGFGYHTLFPSDWTNARGKTCPGTIRIPQFRTEILPAIAGNAHTQEESSKVYPLISDVYRLWRGGDDLAALKDPKGLEFWLRHGDAVGERQLYIDLTGAFAAAAGFKP